MRTVTAFSLALAAAASGPAFAQAGPEDDGGDSGDEVRVVGRRELERRFSSTATRVTIGRRDIENMGALSVADILRQAPGVQVTTNATGGIEIRMRGMGTEATRILIDGVPVSTTSRDAQLPMEEMPADLIERIEVIRAPTAETQGAAGGTLNIVLRGALERREVNLRVMDQLSHGRQTPSVFASATGPLTAATRDPGASSWTYLVSMNAGERSFGSDTRRKTSVNTAAPTSATVDDAVRLSHRFLTIAPRLTGRLGVRDRITLRGILSGFDQGGETVSSSLGLSSGTAQSIASRNPWQYGRGFAQAAADWTHSLSNGRWENTLQLERTHSEQNATREATTVLGGATTRTGSRYDDNRQEHGLLGRTKVEIASGQDVWSGGGDLEVRNVGAVSQSSLAAGGAPQRLDSTTRRLAAWTQYETGFESIETAAVFGLRAQDYLVTANAAGTGVRNHSLTWQPSVSTRTRLSEDLQYRFNLARINRNPRVFEVARLAQPNLATNSPNAPDFVGNANLKPERTLTLDTGLEQRIANGGQAGLNVFVRHQTDVIRRRLFLSGTRWTEQPDNIGSANIWGLEGDLRSSLALLGGPRDWTLNTHLTLLGSRMTGGGFSGQRLPGQARYLGNINIAKPQRNAGWFGGGTLTLTGPADLNEVSTAGSTTTGRDRGRFQLDLNVGSVITQGTFWRVNLTNLLDYKQQRSRVVTDTTTGTVNTEDSVRQLGPRVTLTVGTRL